MFCEKYKQLKQIYLITCCFEDKTFSKGAGNLSQGKNSKLCFLCKVGKSILFRRDMVVLVVQYDQK